MMKNHLTGEKSPYLLQHQENPVDWFPWGEEALARAKAEDKPIFLSIGYSTCHWCHVMARESFENAETAALLNERFISIKVDREERPDVDRVYMAFVQTTTGSGGWPMSVWLTPDGHPFFGGTYFPPSDAYGRAGFSSVLTQIAQLWETGRDRVDSEAARLLATLQETGDPGSGINKSWLAGGYAAFEQIYDEQNGGFGDAPKFPRPSVLNFLFRGDDRSRAMALLSLRAMSCGGMRDQLGGGFHRYSVDTAWHVPHFEKMLYDQAQIAISLVEAWQITGDEFFQKTAGATLDYVLSDLTHPDGGFFSAEDADSLLSPDSPVHAEGAFYVWTQSEIAGLLDPNECPVFCSHYGVEAGGNAPEGSDPHGEFTGKNILIERRSPDETARLLGLSVDSVAQSLASSSDKLLRHRSGRPRPHLDDKILTAWNGLMISAFARAGATFGEPRYLCAARNAADFVLSRLTSGETGRISDGCKLRGEQTSQPKLASLLECSTDNPVCVGDPSQGQDAPATCKIKELAALGDAPGETLLRSWREGPSAIRAFAEDHAFLIQGLLDLYEADFDLRWMRAAVTFQAKQDELFWDDAGGCYFSSEADPLLPARMKDDYDGAEPAANSISALNLLRLARMRHDGQAEARALRILSAHSMPLQRTPTAVPQMLVALDFAVHPPSQAIIVGPRETADALLTALQHTFLPHTVTLLVHDAESREFFSTKAPPIAEMTPLDDKPALYLCENFSCQLPVTAWNPADHC